MEFRLNFYDFLHNRNLYDVNRFHVKNTSNVGILNRVQLKMNLRLILF